MKLVIEKYIDAEICHYHDNKTTIMSKHNIIKVNKDNYTYNVTVPFGGLLDRNTIYSRKLRRLLRTDKCNVLPLDERIIIIRGGNLYTYDKNDKIPILRLKLKNCRNILHQSMAITDKGEIYFGEYGSNSRRLEVPVYVSRNGGNTWDTVFVFPRGKIKHVHGCFYDEVEEKVWVLTGDFSNECHMVCSDRYFKNVEYIGNGQQRYRACNLFFEKDYVHWVMDSQIEDCYHVILDRKTRKTYTNKLFPGPVWYIKRLQDGYYLAATTQEIGPAIHDKQIHLMASKDLYHWSDICQFAHDGLPKRYFKFGVIGFADGKQSSNEFYIFGEAIKGLDGKTALCRIDDQE